MKWTKALAAATLTIPMIAIAQTFPAKPLRLIVMSSPGTPVDIVSRWIVEAMGRDLGQSIVVENRPGGLYLIGLQEALRAPADGYTLAAVGMPNAVAQGAVPNYPVNLSRDLTPVGRSVFYYNVLVVPTKSPIQSITDLIAMLKASPGKYSFFSGGPGTPAHVVGELFKLEVGVDALHVPFSQFPQGVGNLIDGQIDYGFVATAPVVPHINGGRLRALAVTAPKRLAVLSSIPTVGETGFANLQVSDWSSIQVKADTPRAVIDRLNTALNKALTSPDAAAALSKFGAEASPTTPEEMARYLNAEIDRWGKVARAAKIQLQ